MPIKFRCSYCRQFLGISRSRAGELVDCPTCGRTVRVPGLDGFTAPLPEPEMDLEDAHLARALDALAELANESPRPAQAAAAPTTGDQQIPQPLPEPVPIEMPVAVTPVARMQPVGLTPEVAPPVTPSPGEPVQPATTGATHASDPGASESAPTNAAAHTAPNDKRGDSADSAVVAVVPTPVTTPQPLGISSQSWHAISELIDAPPLAPEASGSHGTTRGAARGASASRAAISASERSWPIQSGTDRSGVVDMLRPVLVLLVLLQLATLGTTAWQGRQIQLLARTANSPAVPPSVAPLAEPKSEVAMDPRGVRGRITYENNQRDRLVDAGARVFVLPRQRAGEVKLPSSGFRATDSEADRKFATAALAALGGGFALTSDQGEFHVPLEGTGEYDLIVCSGLLVDAGPAPAGAAGAAGATPSSAIRTQVLSRMSPYFEQPAEVLGRVKVATGAIQFRGTGTTVWDHTFPQ